MQEVQRMGWAAEFLAEFRLRKTKVLIAILPCGQAGGAQDGAAHNVINLEKNSLFTINWLISV